MRRELKFSIITPCLNAQESIEETLRSVLNQTYVNYEYIIVDGASTDQTMSIVEKYAPAFQGRMRWTSEKDFGIYNAMNRGIVCASGDYVIFMNAGDSFYRRDVLETAAKQIEKNGNQGVYFGKAQVIRDLSENHIVDFAIGGDSYLASILKGSMPCHQGIFAPLALLRRTCFNEKYKIRADFDWIAKSYKEGIKFIRMEEIICNYAGGGISERSKSLFVRETDEILKRHFPILYRVKKVEFLFPSG